MPNTRTPIAQAARLLRAAAKDIKDCHTRGDEDWTGELEALAAHDEHLAAAQALELIEKPGDDLTKRLIAACRHTTLTWEDRRAVGEAIARLQTTKPAQEDAVDSVRQAIRDYHFALDNRVHGILAANKALKAVEAALGTHWVQGKELAARAVPHQASQ